MFQFEHIKHWGRGLMEVNEQSLTNTARLSVMAKRTKTLVHENERILIADGNARDSGVVCLELLFVPQER